MTKPQYTLSDTSLVVSLDLTKNGEPLVVGSDKVAIQKVQLLHSIVHSPISLITGQSFATPEISALADQGLAHVQNKTFQEKDLVGKNVYVHDNGFQLTPLSVFVSLESGTQKIVKAAQQARIPIWINGNPSESTFSIPPALRIGDQVSVFVTGPDHGVGSSQVYGRLRRLLASSFPESTVSALSNLSHLKEKLSAPAIKHIAENWSFGRLASLQDDQIRSLVDQCNNSTEPEHLSSGNGRLIIVSDADAPDHLSLTIVRHLNDADLVVADRSVPQQVLDLAHGSLIVARRHGKASPFLANGSTTPTIRDDHVEEDDELHQLNHTILDSLSRGLTVIRLTANPSSTLYQHGDVAFFKRHGWEPTFLSSQTVQTHAPVPKFASILTSSATSVRTSPRDSPRLSPVQQHPVLARPQVVKPKILSRQGSVVLSSGLDAIAHVAYMASDVNFVFPRNAKNFLGHEISKLAEKETLNACGIQGRVVNMSSKSGAGNALFGALAAGGNATALLSADALPLHMPVLHEISMASKSGRLSQGVVLHVAAQSIDGELRHRTDYSKVFTAAQVSGFVVLTSHTLQEAQDMSLVAHVAAIRGGLTILHVFDGTRIALQNAKIQAFSREQLEHALTSTSKLSGSPHAILDEVFENLSHLFGQRYHAIEYVGDDEASVAFVAHGNDAALVEETVHDLVSTHHKVGLVKVRVLNPFDGKSFAQTLPVSVHRIAVLPNVREGQALIGDVVASVRGVEVVGIKLAHDVESITRHAIRHLVHDLNAPKLRLPRVHTLSQNDVVSKEQQWAQTIGRRPSLIAQDFSRSVKTDDSTRIVVWEGPVDTQHVDHSLVEALSLTMSSISAFTQHDSLNPSKVRKTEIRLGPQDKILASASVQGNADVVIVTDATVLERYNVATDVKHGGALVLNVDWEVSQAGEHLPADIKRDVAHKKIQLLVVDATKISKDYTMFVGNPAEYLNLALQAVVYAQLEHKDQLLEGLRNHIHKTETSFNVLRTKLAAIAKIVNIGQHLNEIPSCWLEAPQNESHLLTTIPGTVDLDVETSVAEEAVKVEAQPHHHVAWNVLFKEAYQAKEELRPDVGETFVVTLTENRRVTPHSYDRNIMHLEMDIRNTGFKYDLGDALAVYGENDPKEVDEFLHAYGIKSDDVVYITRGSHTEARTAAQIFTSNLDLFGKPTKKFYQDLSEYAKDEQERKKLALLGSADGAEEFQRRADETVTFADILHEFKSARPCLKVLSQIIPSIKPRAYSISSSMKMHPDSVHLLVVLVSWPGKDGKERFGQCTRYLNSLKPGAKLIVGRTPSVMKLPHDDATPVVMSGLGTGMAPFRAFIEERAVRKTQLHGSKNVGEMSLYFGSRHRAMEYLYGEELDAYHADGLVTDLRLAFSRDQREKVYIQNKMEEDADRLYDLLVNKKGHFYLCGPTWPVPDVKAALIKSFVKHGWTKENAEQELENMKEQERYVLEVY